jgi:hypothetical protein
MTYRLWIQSARRGVLCLWALAAVGFAVRLALIFSTKGTDDVVIWESIASYANEHGLATAYRDLDHLNHPPVMTLLALCLWKAAQSLGLPFAWLIKIPSLAGDVLTALVLYGIWTRGRGGLEGAVVVAGFGWSLCSILSTGYHGNTDGLYAAAMLIAAYAHEEKKSPFLTGVGLSLAYNVKLIPLLVAPGLLLLNHGSKTLAKFAAGAALGLVPFLALYAVIGKTLLANVLGYAASPDLWGIPLMLIENSGNLWDNLAAEPLLLFYQSIGRYVILLSVLALAAANFFLRRWNAYEISALSLAVFLVTTPGFAIQYLVSLVPLMFAIRLRDAMTYSSLAGLFMAVTYYRYLVPGERPLFSHFGPPFPMPAPLFGVLAWAFLLIVVSRILRKPVQESPSR